MGIIKKIDLIQVEDLTTKKIFKQILDILRTNAVSDKQNAFLKIINLLLSKVYDEEKGDRLLSDNKQGLFFQYIENEDALLFNARILDCYTKGMKEYFKIETLNTDIDFFSINRDDLKNIITRTSEFHFIEVFNQKTFEDNTKILIELINVMQYYSFKNEDSSQMLGDFFESLLNTAIKQDAGQFFTPMPLVNHIINSLPLKSVMESNISNNKEIITPYIIDYACGSGHFITSAIEAVKKEIKTINPNIHSDSSTIYGIEKDYRLAKTAKINSLLNGDGKTNIFHADGLDIFNSECYSGELKTKDYQVKNEIFDFVIANPPYSVKGFFNSINNENKESPFELLKHFNENSKEIETLFIERTEQLLKNNGIAAIVLPKSITNTDKYTIMREFLFKNFDLKAIVYLGSNTFADTSTCPVIIYIQKKQNIDYKEQITITLKSNDVISNEIENGLSKYLENKNCSIADYKLFMNYDISNFIELDKAISAIQNIDKYFDLDFQGINIDKKLQIINRYRNFEIEKINLFLNKNNKKCIVVNAPTESIKKERDFLGYEFSNNRNKVGIKIYEKSELSNLKDSNDKNKISSVIRDFLTNDSLDNEKIKNMNKNIDVVYFNDILEYNQLITNEADITFSYCWTNRIVNAGKNYLFLKDIVDFNNQELAINGRSIKIGDIKLNKIKSFLQSKTSKLSRVAKKNDLVMPFLTPSIEKIVLIDDDHNYVLDTALCGLNDTYGLNGVLYKYLLDRNKSALFFEQIKLKLKGFKESYSRINESDLKMIKIPIEDLECFMNDDEKIRFKNRFNKK